MNIDLFDFELPECLIAQAPVEPRDHCRLMVLDRAARTISHRFFYELPQLLHDKDLLVRNDTRVIPARVVGVRDSTGGRWEALFLEERPEGGWHVLAHCGGKPRPGETVTVGLGLKLRLIEKFEDGSWRIAPEPPDSTQSARELLETHGHIPLPPYIRDGRDTPEDRQWYQTVFAREAGSVAAPTAGLHFTEGLISELVASGIEFADVTLHVGIGTFRPIKVDNIEDHVLHAEWASLPERTSQAVRTARTSGGRVIAVGTTSARTLETAARSGTIEPFEGPTGLYIRPGFEFHAIDGLITNFHLPRSSLIVLVAALAGHEFVMEAYHEAVRLGYRFYSYGDAMLIV
ncbi:tRNA preQ1(34) S-adenosylmethionine ribosyltransferase-isomerase QueA [bacterium]|nr:tRNA preQ1(34) S-adenosylmethionine ribosyltransferase-isomerase QueA [bacterium]